MKKRNTLKMKNRGFKSRISRILKDERGMTISSESLILIVGTSVVASVVIGAITVMLTGSEKDGSGGITKNITDNIAKIIDDKIITD